MATEIVICGKMYHMSNALELLKLPTVHLQQICGDMIEMYKFVTEKNDLHCKLKLNFHSTLASAYDTRGSVYTACNAMYELKKPLLY